MRLILVIIPCTKKLDTYRQSRRELCVVCGAGSSEIVRNRDEINDDGHTLAGAVALQNWKKGKENSAFNKEKILEKRGKQKEDSDTLGKRRTMATVHTRDNQTIIVYIPDSRLAESVWRQWLAERRGKCQRITGFHGRFVTTIHCTNNEPQKR